MGIKKISLRKRLYQIIVYVLIFSIVCTAVTWLILLFVYDKKMNYANHFEKMIPAIEAKLKNENDELVAITGKPILETILPSEGFKYKVVNPFGVYQYGTMDDQANLPSDQVVEKLNLVEDGPGNYFVKYIPITNEHHVLQGVLLLYYQLKVTPIEASDAILLKIASFLFLVTPFGYVILFTIIFARKLSKEIKVPLSQLIKATSYIRNQNLQFSLKSDCAITEIGQLTEAFERMRNELSDSLQREWTLQKERKESVAALAHDIRTPLTIIQGHIEGLEEARKKGIDRFDRYIPVIKSNMKRAVKLIHDLNETATLENDSFQLNKVQVNPQLFFDEKIYEYTMWCTEATIRFTGKWKDERKEKLDIYIDPDRLSQVLDNLISNSLRFTSGEIMFDARLDEEFLFMRVSDNGPGFGRGKEEQLFDPFYQGRTGESRKNGHAGLGLYIAKMIVLNHDGEIEAYTGENGGAIVTIKLPYR